MPLNVLVVDDILDSRRQLCALVNELGHAATGADGGVAALSLVRTLQPDLVLLDLLMPDLDGFEVTRRIRALHAAHWFPIVVTSSLPGEQHFIRALDSGADDYLLRPVSAELLNSKLKHYGRVLAMQSRLSTLAHRQRAILDNVLDPLLTLDASGCVSELNDAAGSLVEAGGQPVSIGMHCQRLFGLSLAELQTCKELDVRSAAKGSFAAAVSLSAWSDGEQQHYTLTLRDLTEQRAVERMKDEFLATVSHELRTPLTSIIGALGLLAGGAAGALPGPALGLAQVARRNGDRLSRLIDDILDLTKLEGDRLVLHLRPQALVALVRESLAANQGYAERAGVRLVSEGLAALEGVEVRLDADRFLQVMANLLSNAIKHAPAQSTVTVSASIHGKAARVMVRDQGPGIDPRFRGRMFEKFSQADGTDRRAKGGTGLGLYVTRLLVERMGGRITADDVADAGGASFSVWFDSASLATERPAVLHIDNDFDRRSRIARWLAPLADTVRLEGASTLAEGTALVPHPMLIIANPQDQLSVDEFCLDLKRAAAGHPVLLFGGSAGPAFSRRAGIGWLDPATTGADELCTTVLTALASTGVRSSP